MKRYLILFVILIFCFSVSAVNGQEGPLSKEDAEKVILRCFNEVEECQGEDFFSVKVLEIDDSSIALVEMFADGQDQERVYLKLVKDNNIWKIAELSPDKKEWMQFEEEVIPALKEFCKEMKEKREAEKIRRQNPVQATVEDLERIGFTIEAWKEDTGKAPQGDSLEKVAEIIKEYYDFHTLVDIWGNAFLYKAEGDTYWVASAGSDGNFDGFDQTGQYDEDDTRDIIFSNGDFTYRPKEKK